MSVFASLDIGGTAVKWGLVNEDGVVLSSGEFPTEAEKGPDY